MLLTNRETINIVSTFPMPSYFERHTGKGKRHYVQPNKLATLFWLSIRFYDIKLCGIERRLTASACDAYGGLRNQPPISTEYPAGGFRFSA